MTDPTPTPPVGGAGQVPVLADPPSEPREPAADGSGTVGDAGAALRPGEGAERPATPHDAEPVHPVWGYGTLEPIPGQVEQFGRILDPVRACALEQAIAHVNYSGAEGPDVPGEVLAIAERFETWLARDEGGR
jgi:hypothetical protein